MGFLLSSIAVYAFPPEPENSDLTVELIYAGEVPNNTISATPNIASPVKHKQEMFIVDQHGAIFKWSKKNEQTVKIFDISQAPPELTLTNNPEAILNVVGGRSKKNLYVVFSSPTLPSELNAGPYKTNECSLPTDGSQRVCDLPELIETHPHLIGIGGTNTFDMYRMGTVATGLAFLPLISMSGVYQILYEFHYDGEKLSKPRPIIALETQAGLATHRGGGMTLTKDGQILWATGDAVVFGLQGRYLPQDNTSHIGKILSISPKTGAIKVMAKGQRNVQRLQLVISEKQKDNLLAWTNIGGWVSEEFNIIRVKDLNKHPNFGWGCEKNIPGTVQCALNAKTREGTFYVTLGTPLTFGTPPKAGDAPIPEQGYVQPFSQYGRIQPFSFAAITGPVISKKSLNKISALFGDLPSGAILATTAPLLSKGAITYKVNLFDEYGNPLAGNSLNALNGGNRVDPRFFLFPDGTAGVLLEATGKFYRIKEIEP